MKRIIASLAALMIVGAAQAQTTFEVGAGIAQAHAQHDGNWYQLRFPHHLSLRDNALEVGARTELSEHVAFDTHVFWLGRSSSDALAVTNDASYQPKTPTGCGGPCPPLTSFVGHGYAGGVSAMLEIHTAGDWQWGFAAGPVLYRETWAMDIPRWFPSEGSVVTGPVQNVHLYAAAWSWRPAAALRLTHDRWYASLTYYRDGASLRRHDFYPPIWQSHLALLVGYRF